MTPLVLLTALDPSVEIRVTRQYDVPVARPGHLNRMLPVEMIESLEHRNLAVKRRKDLTAAFQRRDKRSVDIKASASRW